jgi:ectoine utilization protein EutC
MEISILNEEEIRDLIGPAEAFHACREAFMKLARGEVIQPDVLSVEIPEHNGEVHAKGGYIRGARYFSIKVAAGFYDNAKLGLPTLSGAVWVFDASTGFLHAIFFDNGFLTNLRTAAAGAIAADLLARKTVRRVAVLGCGLQGRYQLEALFRVRQPESVIAYNRTLANAQAYAQAMQMKYGIPVAVSSNVRSAVEGADLVITATPVREPIVQEEWISPGTHITAVGSDMPEKQELDVALLQRSKVVADRLAQCVTQGEIHHALKAGVLRIEDVYAELGEIAAGMKPGRTSEDEITIADLTGVGVLDAAVANYVMHKGVEFGVGRKLSI